MTGCRRTKVRRTAAGVAAKAGTPGRTPQDLDSGSGSVPTWAGTLSKSLSSLGHVSILCELLMDYTTEVRLVTTMKRRKRTPQC